DSSTSAASMAKSITSTGGRAPYPGRSNAAGSNPARLKLSTCGRHIRAAPPMPWRKITAMGDKCTPDPAHGEPAICPRPAGDWQWEDLLPGTKGAADRVEIGRAPSGSLAIGP